MLPAAIEKSEPMLRKALGPSEDIICQELRLRAGGRKVLLVFVEGMIDRDSLQEHAIAPLATTDLPEGLPPTLEELGFRLISVVVRKVVTDPAQVREKVCRGNVALLIDGYPGALVLGLQDWEERAIQSSPSESGLRGPRDAFVENVVTNINLIRRRLNDPHLIVKYYRVGVRSRTLVAVLHIADIARDRLVTEIQDRVAAIEFDGVLDSAQMRELITGMPWAPKMEMTERPDKIVAGLLSGKVAVVTDNSPFTLTAPTTLMDTLWAADDYYSSPAITILTRFIRLVGVGVTLFLSPLYVGITMFNPGLLRSDLAFYMARERAGIPLVPTLETIFLEIMMEVLHEATIRLPSKIGSAATVVGGLIIGQAAVQARLLSGIVVIVAAISAIGSFTLPSQEMGQAWRVTKWALILAASTFGVYGIFVTSFMLFSWLASQDSFGTPYLAPVAPLIPGDLARDSLLRKPWGLVRRRAQSLRPKDPDRTSRSQDLKYRDGGER